MSVSANASTADIFAANRARGEVAFTAQAVGGRTTRRRVTESGSLRVRFPNVSTEPMEAVLVNTAGGMAGGDRFAIDVGLSGGAAVTLTTAAAEKIYRAAGSDTAIGIKLSVNDSAALAWLPQETILFDGAALSRRIDVTLEGDASLLMAEATIFGRTGMGERMNTGMLDDHWRIRRDGRLIHAEAIHLSGAVGATLSRTAVLGGHCAVATLLRVPAADTVDRLRARADAMQGETGVSAWNGIAVARFAAPTGATLRHDLMLALNTLCAAGLPRLWLQ